MSRRTPITVLAALAAALVLAPAALASPAQISWFYKPPTDGASARAVAAATSGQMVLTKRDEHFLQQLRDVGYRAPILQYIEAAYSHGPSGVLRPTDPCDAGFAPWGNNVLWNQGDFCRFAHPNEDWFLHNGKGERLIHGHYTGSHGVFYAMNPASPGWRAFYASRVRQALFGDASTAPLGYDGIFLDDVWTTRRQLLSRLPNSDGVVREFSSDAAYRNAVVGLIQAVRSAASSRPVYANTDGNDFYRRYLDGTMREDFAGSWNNSYMEARTIQEVWATADATASAGKRMLLVSQGRRTDLARMRFSYAAYLMVAGPRVSFRYSQDAASYRELWTYPEYALDLGAPTGRRSLVAGSTFRRDFSNGVAVVNLSATGGRTVDLGGVYRAVDGTLHTRITLPARTGAVLTRATVAPARNPGAARPASRATPRISGTPREGSTLSASPGTWATTSSLAYAWLRCGRSAGSCRTIAGANKRGYKLGPGDVGSTVRVRVTARSGGASASAVSAPTGVIARRSSAGSKPGNG